MEIKSWNRYSRRFIDPPVFEVDKVPGARHYRMILVQDDRSVEVASDSPRLDARSVWSAIRTGRFTIRFEARGAAGGLVGAGDEMLRFKAPDWSGWNGQCADWSAAADRNIAWLIDAAEHAPAPWREPGVPTWVWCCSGPYPDYPQGQDCAYPALHLPLLIRAFLAHARAGGPHAAAADRLARSCGDWLLAHRRPDSGALALFPYSTISMGRYEGDKEIGAINLTRGCTVGAGLVELFRRVAHAPWLDYAEPIARVTMRFQRADGSFPYRVNPDTGAVVEDFTPHAIEFIALAESLESLRPDPARVEAARRALDWMLAEPVARHHWQAGFEDVPEKLPYSNLGNWATNDLIVYLCRHAGEDPAFVVTAERLNRWIEDQFVVFGPDDSLPVPTHAPLAMEQYHCYWPMEVHTGKWIVSLLALHAATGRGGYLDKARAAGNAICASQYANGEFGTYPMDAATGRPATEFGNWYGCNALAAEALYRLAQFAAEST